MKGYLVDVEFMWGFQSGAAGMSKSPPSFLLPPPTTVLGAIAEAYARRKGLSESSASETMCRLAKNLLALSYKFLNAVPLAYQDLGRIVTIRISGGIRYPSAQDPYGSFDAPARGRTILSTVDARPPLMRVFAVFEDTADITADDLWKIRRIGTKESMVSVVNVEEGGIEVLRDGVVETDYLLPLTPEIERSLSGRSGLLELEFVPVHYLKKLCKPPAQLYLEGMRLRHIISVPPHVAKVSFRLPAGCVGYKMGEEVVVGIES